MKYAILDGKLTHISKVKKGTIARVFGYRDDGIYVEAYIPKEILGSI